ncbi:MAG: hypothetical protein ACJ76W_08095 [Chloroflexota bacterium]
MKASREGSELVVEGGWYRLRVPDGRGVAWLEDDGGRWAELRLLTSIDALDGRDETLGVGDVIETIEPDGTVTLTWDLTSSRWDAKRIVVAASEHGLVIHAEVEGRGAIDEVTLLAGPLISRRTSGRLMSGAWFESVVCASPTDPGRIAKPASESALIGVVSGSEPGRGNWFFTPGPFVFAANRSPVADPLRPAGGPWLWFGLAARRGEAGFTGWTYRALDRGFGFGLEYDGKTTVDGTWLSPGIIVGRAADPYESVAEWRAALERSDVEGRPGTRPQPAWWRQPIFCGWGAQGALARDDGRGLAAAKDYATQANYDAFLAALAAHGVRPGTVVIDDKWQTNYATGAPDTGKWPDLHGWIASRHDAGQRVLLWYKAWDAEGLPAAGCVRARDGTPLRVDPSHPDGEAAIRESVRRMLGGPPEGLDADGLKIDFTATTPSGAATEHHGPAWGVDLLGRLLDIIADEARSVRPEALLVGHAPNPLVAAALDMIRLNDTLRLDDPRIAVDVVAQMTHRAAIVKAACPDHLIDTDDWCAPSLAGWRAYTAAKPSLGVPALYYASHLDLTGERFEERDYELIRRTWADYRTAARLDDPTATAGGRTMT